ncbi:unnamed protein product [Tuber aestivum]|uniref:Sister chromatid cohesion protein Dcc1 n=1 Tax=Tuber aestivum TaxID=59557 RepID=A0A292PNC2_9PEZI|nr:unnamed protein product [Tuber aestivum]
MSTQANTGIPFSYSHSQSPIHLIELPPTLLSLVTSPSPPIIKIKAAPTPANATAPRGSENHAVLCTPTQTFSLRHVHCSNSILLVQPSEPPPPDPVEDEQQQTFSLTSTCLRAVATASSWLELIPVTADCASLLREKIPVYHGWADDDPALPTTDEPISRARLLDSIPISDAEFSAAWDELLAFEANNGAACRPSATAILRTISEINTSATAESFPLSSPSAFTGSAILGMLDDVEIPAGLVTVVIGSICDRVEGSTDENTWRLNKDKCCVFVGEALLQDCMEIKTREIVARRPNTATLITRSAFMAKWKAAVPEECISKCRLDTIQGWHALFGDADPRVTAGSSTASLSSLPAPAKNTAPAKKNWHERLGKRR